MRTFSYIAEVDDGGTIDLHSSRDVAKVAIMLIDRNKSVILSLNKSDLSDLINQLQIAFKFNLATEHNLNKNKNKNKEETNDILDSME